MGAWGESVTANDLAQDLKNEYSAAFCTYDVPTALEKNRSVYTKRNLR